ncbi:hypothetical protein [Aeromonas hydrophila]|uniref:hypothetical protein n=1 Tax=Aeromonas hydrophila TaxID=644 RepID=UPI000FDC9EE9|nr:hypothetical protein [Aeromonas hydrophila]
MSSADVTLTETDAPLVTGGTLTATDVETRTTPSPRSPWWASTASSPWRRTARTFTANSAFNELNVATR